MGKYSIFSSCFNEEGFRITRPVRTCLSGKSFLFIAVLTMIMSGRSVGWATCAIEAESSRQEALILHLSKTCTDEERIAHAINADVILKAIEQGKEIDLVGVVIEGNLALDELPLVETGSLTDLPPAIMQLLLSENVTTLRIVKKALSIREGRLRGSIATKLKEGYLLILGPMTMSGTTFERTVDLSHTIFGESVDWSNVVFSREAFFIRGHHYAPARFDRVSFEGHARFHLAEFREDATFGKARFNSLAEFLEVTFRKHATFSHAVFKMGTGFSGSRFEGDVDFLQTVFEREAYFLFTDVAGNVSFNDAAFRGIADFSDAEFHGDANFSHAVFAVAPLFHRATVHGSHPVHDDAGQDPRTLYVIAGILAIFTGVLLWTNRRVA